jgi:hypothetical protein
MAVGDVAAQSVAGGLRDFAEWDGTRTFSMACLGLFGHAPYFHTWYKWLDARFVGTARATVAKKLAIDLSVIGPTYLSIVLGYTYAIGAASPTWTGAVAHWNDKFLPLYSGGVSFHAVVQLFNFALVPPRQRVLYDNVVSLCWKTALSLCAHAGLDESRDDGVARGGDPTTGGAGETG